MIKNKGHLIMKIISHTQVRSSVTVIIIILLCLLFTENRILPQWISVGGALSWGTMAGQKEIDAVTGATRMGWGGSVSYHWPVFGRQSLRIGIDFTEIKNDMTYSDSVRKVDGTRSISLLIVSLPVLYTIPLVKPKKGSGAVPPFSIGIGPFLGYVADKLIHENGNLDNYHFNRFNIGPYIHAEINPINFNKDFSIGFNIDIFRTFFIKTYNDPYFDKNKSAGNIGAIKIGIILSKNIGN